MTNPEVTGYETPVSGPQKRPEYFITPNGRELERTPASITTHQKHEYLKAFEDLEWLDHKEAMLVRNLWEHFAACYMDYFINQYNPLPDIPSGARAAVWQASGLVNNDADLSKITSIDTNCIVDSIQSGKIHAITGNQEQHAAAFTKFMSCYTNSELVPGPADLDDLRMKINDLKYHDQVINTAIHESIDQPYQGKYITGPYKKIFEPITQTYLQRLAAIDPRLNHEVFQANHYQSMDVVGLRIGLGPHASMRINMLAESRIDALESSMHEFIDIDMAQTIPVGLLDQPDPAGQTKPIACSTAVFRIIHRAVSGHLVAEEETRQHLRRAHGTDVVHDEDYLKIFQTETFEREYGKRVQSYCYAGMSLEKIAEIATAIRKKRPQANIYAVAGLRTEGNEFSRAQHRIVLLGAGVDEMYVIDPRHTDTYTMPKQEFLSRWAAVQNSGYIVISENS